MMAVIQPICKNCMHWTCYKGNRGDCHSNKFNYGLYNLKANGLAYEDYESYKAAFITGALFGCIHFKLRGDYA